MPTERDRLEGLVRQQTTVAGKIRALAAAGVPRADIARFLGKRYQHVRNVLEDDAAQRSSGGYVVGRADLSGVREEAPAFEREADERQYVERRGGGNYRLVVRPDGSLVLPKEVAEKLNAAPGGVVMAKLDGDEFNLVSVEAAIREVQQIMEKYRPADGSSLVDRYLEEKYAEAAREEAKWEKQNG